MARIVQLAAVFLMPIVFTIGTPCAHAGSVAISWKSTDAPAVDLIYNHEQIDRDDAIDLKSRGVDLSALDPVPNDVWQPTPAPAPPGELPSFPSDGATVDFDSDLAASQGMFRSRVLTGTGEQTQAFQLLMSLSGHASLARAALMQKLGYPIPTPHYYRTLTVRFKDLPSRAKFLDDLSDSTLTSRKRWVAAMPDGVPELTVQDVILEPAEIEIPMYHWGAVPASALKGRRAVRALVVPIVLLDVAESANLYSWELGRVIDSSVILTSAYADKFGETTFDDARWIARRIARLTRADFEQIVAAAHYPDDVGRLVTEKAVARRNQLVQLFKLDRELPKEQLALPYNTKLSIGAVKEGKLTQSEYPGYALRFTYGDPDSPLRASEVGKFLLVKGISTAIEAATALANQYLTIQSPLNVVQNHANQVMSDYYKFLHDHPGQAYVRPLGAWAGPVAGFGVSASRDIVSGTYFGSDSRVQLVDNLAMQANVGFFMGFDGIPVVGTAVSGNVVIQRNYIHVKPINDMSAALKSDWKEVFVPAFLAELNSKLDGPVGASGTSGASGDQTGIDNRLHAFLDTLKEGEMLIMTDSVMLGVAGQVTLSAPILAAPILNPSLSLGASASPTVLRRTTFRRTTDGVQVYMQNAAVMETDVEFDFNWIVNILKLSHTSKQGWGKTKAYLLDKEPDSPEERRHLLVALRALLIGHSSEILEENFKDYELSHFMNTGINAAQILAWHFNGISSSHRVKIKPPDHPEAERTLFSNRVVSIKGLDGFNFLADIVTGLSGGLVTIGNSKSTGYNPAYSFMGSANWISSITEAEITAGTDFAPVTTIQHHFGGWLLFHNGLMKVLDGMQRQVKALHLDHPLIRPDEFTTTKNLQLYDVMSTLIIYQPAMKRISQTVFEPAHVRTAVDGMLDIEGRDEMKQWCGGFWRRFIDFFGADSYSEKENGQKISFHCLKPWMRDLLHARHDYQTGSTPKTAERHVTWINDLMRHLEQKLEVGKLLAWLGNDNFFFQIRVSGFRSGDENGDNEYLSDSVGSFDSKAGAGVFKDFATKTGILTSELNATYLSEGY